MIPALVVVALAALAAAGHRLRRRRVRAEQAAIDASLAFTVDLLTVVIGSGGTIHSAVAATATDGPHPIRPHFAAVLDRVDRGHRLVDALAEASITLGSSFHPLVGTLVAAEADGAPVGSVLDRLADDVLVRDRLEAEGAAGRLPVALLAPLVVCLLPSVVVGAVVPLAIVALRQLG